VTAESEDGECDEVTAKNKSFTIITTRQSRQARIQVTRAESACDRRQASSYMITSWSPIRKHF